VDDSRSDVFAPALGKWNPWRLALADHRNLEGIGLSRAPFEVRTKPGDIMGYNSRVVTRNIAGPAHRDLLQYLVVKRPPTPPETTAAARIAIVVRKAFLELALRTIVSRRPSCLERRHQSYLT
jgi:hypothetical protein